MWLSINPRSPKPVYQQIVDAVKEAVAKGVLQPGERMPSVRELATQMAINHNTVARAFQELERDHLIEVERGRGTFVAASRPRLDRDERVEAVRTRIRELVVDAHHLQLTEEDLLELFRATLHEWRQERRQVQS